jgi:Spy/CpxP family protein refolding chaperone
MKARRILATALAVALLAVPGFIIAQVQDGGGPGFGAGGPGHGGFHPGMFARMMQRLGDHIGLTDEQRASIEAILAEQGPAIRDLGRQMAEARQDFMESSDPDTFDAEAVREFAETQAPLHVDFIVATAQLKADLFGVLTLEQREKLEELRTLMGPRGGRRGHRGPGGSGGSGGQGLGFGGGPHQS